MSVVLVLFTYFFQIFLSTEYSDVYLEKNYLLGKYVFDLIPKHDICELNELTPEQIRKMIPHARNHTYFQHKTDDELYADITQFIQDYDKIPNSNLPIETTFISYLYSHDSCLLYALDRHLLIDRISSAIYNGIYVYRDNKIPVSYKEVCGMIKNYLCVIDPLKNKTSLDQEFVQSLCTFSKNNIKKLKKNKRGATPEIIFKLAMEDSQFSVLEKQGKIHRVLGQCLVNKFAREARSGIYSCEYQNFDNTKYEQLPVNNLEQEENQVNLNPKSRHVIPDHYNRLEEYIIPFRISGRKECLLFDDEEEEDDEQSFVLDVPENRLTIKLYNGYIVFTVIVFTFTLLVTSFVLIKKYLQKRRSVNYNLESADLLA